MDRSRFVDVPRTDSSVVSTCVVFTLAARKVFLSRVVLMSNFSCSTASATQKNLTFIEQDHCCLVKLFAMSMAAELSQCTSVGGCGSPITSSISLKIDSCLHLKNSAPSLASIAEEMTECKIAHKVKNAPFNLMGLVGSLHQPMKKNVQMLCCGCLLLRDTTHLSEYSVSCPRSEVLLLIQDAFPSSQGAVWFQASIFCAFESFAFNCVQEEPHLPCVSCFQFLFCKKMIE
jgi:hypothetical protein